MGPLIVIAEPNVISVVFILFPILKFVNEEDKLRFERVVLDIKLFDNDSIIKVPVVFIVNGLLAISTLSEIIEILLEELVTKLLDF